MKKISHWAWVLVLGVCTFGNVAVAEENAAQPPAKVGEVFLNNGSMMRGTIIAVEPGQRVIVIVAGKESILPWGEIARVVEGPTDAATNPVMTPSIHAAPSDMPVKGMPRVHIESDWPDVELSRVEGSIGGGFHHGNYGRMDSHALLKYVCRAPCDKLVDGREGHAFTISGPGMFPPNQFRLDTSDGDVTARVHGTSVARYAGGAVSVAAGGMFALGGTLFFAANFATTGAPTPKNPDPDRVAKDVRSFSLVLGGIGVAAVVTGIVLLSTGRSHVELIKTSRGDPLLTLDRGILRF